MVEYKVRQLNKIFHALGDATRRQLLQCLAKEPACNVVQLAEPFSMLLNAVSKHLKVLEQAGLIKRQKQWRVHYLEFNHKALDNAAQLINQLKSYWEERLDSLEDYFKNKK